MIARIANTKSLAVMSATMLALIASSATGTSAAGQVKYEAVVGMPLRIEQIVLPGSELVARPLDETNRPIVLRITGVFPHGSDYRYDLEFYGLEPGTFNLSDYLQRKDGSAIGELPPLTVEIRSTLPPGQIEPTTLESVRATDLGGYRTWCLIAVVVWLIGLPLILFLGRKSKRKDREASGPLSLADRPRPLVEEAMAGQMADSRLAQLERALVVLWRDRLNLNDMKAADAIVVLRQHEQAGALLRQLETWLHRPGGEQDVDVAAILAPYQDLPADELSLSPQHAGTVT